MIGEWLDIGWLEQIPVRGSRTVPVEGGEEIAVILPATGAEGAHKVAEAVRAAVEALAVHHAGGSNPARTVTVSIGAATAFARVGGGMKMPEGLLLAADGALYKAKRNGRNRMEAAVLLAARDQSAARPS